MNTCHIGTLQNRDEQCFAGVVIGHSKAVTRIFSLVGERSASKSVITRVAHALFKLPVTKRTALRKSLIENSLQRNIG
jgi:hypothetical protein